MLLSLHTWFMFSWWYSHLLDQCFSALFRSPCSQLCFYSNLIRWTKIYVNQVSQSFGRYPHKIRSINTIKIQIKKAESNKWWSPCDECRSLTATLGGGEQSASHAVRLPLTKDALVAIRLVVPGVCSDAATKGKKPTSCRELNPGSVQFLV
jgi:hypothetical protein